MFFPNYSNILGGKNHCLENYLNNFPAGPVTRTLVSQYGEPGFEPWSGNWILHATTESLHAADKIWYSQINK